MNKYRLAGLVGMFSVFAALVVLIQVSKPALPAETPQLKVTGKITNTLIKSFDAAGLPGLVSIEYRRFAASPGTKIENFTFDHAELCTPTEGNSTATLPDGTTLKAKAGDIFTIPLGANFKTVVFDAKLGWVDLCWFLNVKK